MNHLSDNLEERYKGVPDSEIKFHAEGFKDIFSEEDFVKFAVYREARRRGLIDE